MNDPLRARYPGKSQPIPRAADLPPGLSEDLVARVMERHGFTRAVAIEELQKTGHFCS